MHSFERQQTPDERYAAGANLGLTNWQRWTRLPLARYKPSLEDVVILRSGSSGILTHTDHGQASGEMATVLSSPDKEFVNGVINGVVAGQLAEKLIAEELGAQIG